MVDVADRLGSLEDRPFEFRCVRTIVTFAEECTMPRCRFGDYKRLQLRVILT